MRGAICAIFMMTFTFPRRIQTRAVQQKFRFARIRPIFLFCRSERIEFVQY